MPRYEFAADAGVPIVLQIDLDGEFLQDREIDVTWTFSGATAPCAGFEWTLQSGRWRPLAVNNSRQAGFVARLAGTEIVTASIRWRIGTTWFRETEPYIWTVTIRAPRPRRPVIQSQDVSLGLMETPGVGDVPAIVCAARFDFSVDAAGASGQLSAIQLIDSEILYVTGKRAGRYATDDTYVLDTDRREQYLYRAPVSVREHFVMEDHPETGLPTENEVVTDNSKYITALVFRSSSHPNACWVPLQYVAWNYNACAAQIQDGGELKWRLMVGTMDPSSATVAPVPPDLIAWERTYLDITEQQVDVSR